jgi:hypothetical protein
VTRGATQGQPDRASRDGLAAGEGADPERGNGVGAETAYNGAWSRGAAPANQVLLIRSSPYTLACTAKSVSEASSGASPSHI